MNPKTKRIHCVLCNGVIAYDRNNSERFSEHLKVDHEVSEGLDWVVAGSLISLETRQRVMEVIEKSTPFLRTSKVPVENKVKEQSEKAIIDIVLTDEEDEVVGKKSLETLEETEKAANTDTNAGKEKEEPSTENIITEKKVEISCKFCPYKATTNFGLGKHVKKSHPSTPKRAGDHIIKLVQTETERLRESAKKKTGLYKETSDVSETENETSKLSETENETNKVSGTDNETSKISETEKVSESMTKATNVYSDVHKMLVEETKTKKRKSLRTRKSETERLMEEKTEPESAEEPTGKDSNQEVALEEMDKPREETREPSPVRPRDETLETTPMKEETVEPPAKKKRRRTELKSDVQKSVDGSVVDWSPNKILSPSTMKNLSDDVGRFSNFLTRTLDEERSSILGIPSNEDDQSTAEDSDKKKKSKKRKKSDVEREEEEEGGKPDIEAEDLSVVLSRREPEVDLSSSEYFTSKKTMIVNVNSERLQDPGFIEKIHRDGNLPPNWFTYIQFFSNGRRVRDFLTPDRRIIRSIEGVREFLLASSAFTEEEVKTIMSNLSSKSRRSLKQEITT